MREEREHQVEIKSELDKGLPNSEGETEFPGEMSSEVSPQREGREVEPSDEKGEPSPELSPAGGTNLSDEEVSSAKADNISGEETPSSEESKREEGSDGERDLLRKKVELEGKIIDVLKTVYDPEIPVNIYELGLVYSIRIDDKFNVQIDMTLTSPTCPVAGSLPGEVENKIKEIPGVNDVSVALVWDPPWSPEMMSEEAKLQLGFFF